MCFPPHCTIYLFFLLLFCCRQYVAPFALSFCFLSTISGFNLPYFFQNVPQQLVSSLLDFPLKQERKKEKTVLCFAFTSLEISYSLCIHQEVWFSVFFLSPEEVEVEDLRVSSVSDGTVPPPSVRASGSRPRRKLQDASYGNQEDPTYSHARPCVLLAHVVHGSWLQSRRSSVV